jgi:hypothetical protein
MPPELTIALFAAGVLLLLLGAMVFASRWTGSFSDTGELVMGYPLALRIFCMVLGVGPPIGICVLLVIFPPKPDEIYAALGCVALFGGLGALLLVVVFGARLVVSDQGLEARAVFLPWRRMDWQDMHSVEPVGQLGDLKFTARDGRTLKVPGIYSGRPALVVYIREHLPRQAYQYAEWVLRQAER